MSTQLGVVSRTQELMGALLVHEPLSFVPGTPPALDNLRQIPQNFIAINNTELTAIDLSCSNPSGSLKSLPSTYRSSIAPLLQNTQPPGRYAGISIRPALYKPFYPKTSATFSLKTTSRGMVLPCLMNSHHRRDIHRLDSNRSIQYRVTQESLASSLH